MAVRRVLLSFVAEQNSDKIIDWAFDVQRSVEADLIKERRSLAAFFDIPAAFCGDVFEFAFLVSGNVSQKAVHVRYHCIVRMIFLRNDHNAAVFVVRTDGVDQFNVSFIESILIAGKCRGIRFTDM